MSSPAADRRSISPGAVVIANLVTPAEKFLGVLLSIDPTGLGLRAVNLLSFDSWLRELAAEATPSLGPATMFIPMHRVEKVFLDEEVGEVESYRSRFARIAGDDLERRLLA